MFTPALVILARLFAFMSTREVFTTIDHTVGRNPQPSSASDLTPELVAEWEAKLQDPDALTPGERYGLECKIPKLEAALAREDAKLSHKDVHPNSMAVVVRNQVAKQLHEAVSRLEAYKEPVPVEASTLPRYQGKYTDYSVYNLEELEQMWQAHLLRIRNGHMAVRKVRHAYNVRTQLIEAGVWDWKAPVIQCAPKGTLGAYYAALRDIKRECRSIEFEIAKQERALGREVPDTWTQWNTSGICGPAGGEDTRRFPVLKGNLGWDDILDIVKCTPPAPPKKKGEAKSKARKRWEFLQETKESRAELLRWHFRVNGEDFTHKEEKVVEVTF
jgi:hypothetical protein